MFTPKPARTQGLSGPEQVRVGDMERAQRVEERGDVRHMFLLLWLLQSYAVEKMSMTMRVKDFAAKWKNDQRHSYSGTKKTRFA